MKRLLLALYSLLTFITILNAQNVGIGTISPNPSAQLDVSSKNKGFLPPRMTQLQRNNIPSPSQGLIIYCTDCGTYGELQFFNGSFWTNMIGGTATPAPNPPAIGDTYCGGKVAYILLPGDPGYVEGEIHGIIAASEDQNTLIRWSNGNYITTGATATTLGSGNANTNTIISVQGNGIYAAKICADLEQNGYSDWVLPSIDELNKLYLNYSLIGGFPTNITGYWSSSEYDGSTAWYFTFGTGGGGKFTGDKAFQGYIRAVRYF